MALRNQPYFPLYVQDYLTDEKLNLCSWQTQGIYIKILCILHKQKEYGAILFKQNDKQNESTCLDFATILVKNLPCQINEMIDALEELIENEVLTIEGDKLYQKRMYKDGKISEERSKAGKKGGGNPNLYKQTTKQTTKQNNENENENENIDINKEGVQGEKKESISTTVEQPLNNCSLYPFDEFWNDYEKKVGDKEKIRKKYDKLPDKAKLAIKEHIPKYKLAQPEKQFRKNPETYLNNRSWNDEIIARVQIKSTNYVEPYTNDKWKD